MAPALRYAVVTPVRNEAENLRRLAACLGDQAAPPLRWIVVDTGSDDGTAELAFELARAHDWIEVTRTETAAGTERGGPIVRAFEAGVRALAELPDVVVKLDADVSMDSSYFERLLSAFADEPRLGIASGTAEELEDGVWRRRFNTGSSVWGAARAYRRECLLDVRPLEERMGWDGIDELKAHARGWTTRTIADLPFRHHRAEGARDGSRARAWAARGRAAHYMGYRPWYLALRTLHHARREPAALAMALGFCLARLRGEDVCPDSDVRARLRSQQSLRMLRSRRRDAIGASTP